MDSDYLKFTDNYDAPIDSNYSKYDKTYPYKESSYWCVVLKKQADSKIISELTTCQDIIYYANLGYVVIVAWENTNGLSPHFATVLPGNNVDSLYKLKVANVGGSCQFCYLTTAFYYEPWNVKFYCNMQSAPRNDILIGTKGGSSINDLINKYGLWEGTKWTQYVN